MSNFWGQFFHFLGVKKIYFLFFWKHYSVCTEKLHNILFIKKKKKNDPENIKNPDDFGTYLNDKQLIKS